MRLHTTNKNQQELVINGDSYKIESLLNTLKHLRRGSNIGKPNSALLNTMKKPNAPLQLVNTKSSEKRMESRKNMLYGKIMEKDNEQSPDGGKDTSSELAIEESESPSPLKIEADDNQSDTSFSQSSVSKEEFGCERRNDKIIQIKNLESHNRTEDKVDSEKILEDIKACKAHRNESDPMPTRGKGAKLLKKATLKLLKEKKKFGSSISSLFAVDSKFQDAVKLRQQESSNKSEMKFFKKLMFDMKNISLEQVKRKELELLSKLATGYSYALDIEEAKFLPSPLSKDSKEYENMQSLISECRDIKKPEMSKIFTFSRADYTKVTNDEEDISNNENVKQLLDIVKFANAKRQQKMILYRQ